MKNIIEIEKELAEYNGEDRVVSFAEKNKEFDNQPKGFKIHFGLFETDRLIDGFAEGELIVISGKPKSGKTLLAQTITSHFSEIDEKPLWFSYEVPARQFLDSFPELPGGYMPRQLELGNIWWLEQRIYESKIKYNTRIVMIDHLHYLFDMSKVRNPSLEIGAVLRKLKLMAVKYQIIIFIICHTAKIPKGEEPAGEDIRDSSFVLQEPDTILILWRLLNNLEEGTIDEARLKVEMTRRTGVLSRTIKVKKKDGLLEEIE